MKSFKGKPLLINGTVRCPVLIVCPEPDPIIDMVDYLKRFLEERNCIVQTETVRHFRADHVGPQIVLATEDAFARMKSTSPLPKFGSKCREEAYFLDVQAGAQGPVVLLVGKSVSGIRAAVARLACKVANDGQRLYRGYGVGAYEGYTLDDTDLLRIRASILTFFQGARKFHQLSSLFQWGDCLFAEGECHSWKNPDEQKIIRLFVKDIVKTYGSSLDHFNIHVGDPGGCKRDGCDHYKTPQQITSVYLEEFRKINPKIQASFSTWANPHFPDGAGFLDATFIPADVGIALNRVYNEGQANLVTATGRPVDIWGWYITDVLGTAGYHAKLAGRIKRSATIRVPDDWKPNFAFLFRRKSSWICWSPASASFWRFQRRNSRWRRRQRTAGLRNKLRRLGRGVWTSRRNEFSQFRARKLSPLSCAAQVQSVKRKKLKFAPMRHSHTQLDRQPARSHQPIYCSVPLEFVQPWEHAKRIRQIKELGLGNTTWLSFTFHVGNSDAERQRWKEAFPEMAALIDATPKFEALPRHGMPRILPLTLDYWLEHLRLCQKLGLKVIAYPLPRTSLAPADAARLTQAGKDCVIADAVMSEDASMLGSGYSLQQLKSMQRPRWTANVPAKSDHTMPLPDSVEQLNLQLLHDWFLHPFRREVAAARKLGGRYFMCVEASPQFRLGMEAGMNLPLLELVPHDPYEGLAAVRGAAKAYGAALWGVHTALGYYGAPTNQWTPERLQIAYNLFYAGGASIFSEPNIAFQNWGLCSAFFSQRASPPQRLGEEECRDFNHPICVRGREVLAEHYRFTQFHERPQNGPRVNLGFVIGHLDGWAGGNHQKHVWCVDDPAFAAGPAEQTWHHFRQMFATEPWYEQPRKYYWQADPAKPLRYGTPPCGQLDIVPIEAPLDVLQKYGCLVFLGWNTMTPEHYAKLKRYVQKGGRLLMSVPHLSTRLRRDAPLKLINDGDFTDLFGVKVTGPGNTPEEVQFVAQSSHKEYELPLGTVYLESAPLAQVGKVGQASRLSAVGLSGEDRQDARPTVRVLAQSRAGDPILFEHRLGKGCAWLLATWDYPGHRLDAFITDLLRTIADGEQDEIALEGSGVDYAVYDNGPLTTIYLVNKNIYGQPQYPTLIVRGHRIRIRVGGYQMRIAWLSGGLLVSPFDRWVKVTGVQGRKVRLQAETGHHRIQLAWPGKEIRRVLLDRKPYGMTRDAEGVASFGSRLGGTHQLTVAAA